MAAQAYTDLFNTAINTLATTLNAITGLVCITDVRNVQAPCVLLDAMSFTAFNNKNHSILRSKSHEFVKYLQSRAR